MIELDARQQTLSSFDWQWAHLASGDFMPGDRWFDASASTVLARELCAIDPSWFAGKRVLDAGCGQGRWSRALLELGAEVTAIDFSEAGLARTREVCRDHSRLLTRRVDLLSIPHDLATQRFDLVFSFGVLHHTGDTWRALENVASLVGDSGALFLYLYGSTSWEESERAKIEQTRRELASLRFDEKIAELQRRYPGQDPHQLFDLLSPVINDRVRFDEVATRLGTLGFDSVVQTVAHGEIYLRATRPRFPASALTAPVGANSTFARESAKRWLRRSGAAFEATLRAELSAIPRRRAPASAVALLRTVASSASVFDASLPPDRVDERELPSRRIALHDGQSPATPGAVANVRASVVLALGATLGACRYPADYLLDLWTAVDRGGMLVLELPDPSAFRARRSRLERLLDARRPVQEKVARMLVRHPTWSTAHALYAIGGNGLLNPIGAADASALLTGAGAVRVETHSARPGTILLVAHSGK